MTAEDGTWGLGMTTNDKPVVSIINDHMASLLEGEDCMATEKLWDTMFRLASPYSSTGLASYAISAVDLALWDLKGNFWEGRCTSCWVGRRGTACFAIRRETTPIGTWS